MDDELIFLGSGGGRHHIRTQYRATGGIIFKFSSIQSHIDPGPGAIVRVNQYGENPLKTELFIVTHDHIDHSNDISAIIESSREQLHNREYNYFKKGTLIATSEVIENISEYHLNMLEMIVPFKVGDIYLYKNTKIVGTKVVHSPFSEGFGFKIELDDYKIAFTSDSMVYEDFDKEYKGTNILVLNLLRPDSVKCKRHLCTDEVIPYLVKLKPELKCLIITHFGAFMDSPLSEINHIPSQVLKFQDALNIPRVIAAEDGLKLKISDIVVI